MSILGNPVVVSIFVMSLLCLLRFNVLLSIAYSALLAGVLSGMGWSKSVQVFIEGMGGSLETALSYILLGAIACAISQSNLTKILIHWVCKVIGSKRAMFCLLIAFISCFSQNLIPVHIAFIPILIPPLLGLMNRLKIDRRAVACALSFGLQAPYIALPIGFGLIFQNIIKDNLNEHGLKVSLPEVSGVMWIGGLAMVVGLLLAIFVFYARPREYPQIQEEEQQETSKMSKKDLGVLLGAIATFVIQLATSSLPLGALGGILIMILARGITYGDVDKVMEGGLAMMAWIAFVMLVASGFGAVLRESGNIPLLVESASSLMGGYGSSALIMLIVGLLITMGIGTSFGTVPIIAAVFCPLALSLGFNLPSIILLVGIAGALGDSGSPASESTLGPTAGLNADGAHSHIWDTCVPTFLMYNIPLIIAGVIGAIVLNS